MRTETEEQMLNRLNKSIDQNMSSIDQTLEEMAETDKK